MSRTSYRVWPVQCASSFSRKIELLWNVWRRNVTQWDIPAIFGCDPFGRTAEDVLRDKRSDGVSARFLRAIMMPAELAVGETAAGLERVYVAWMTHVVEPMAAFGVIGHTQAHRRRRHSTILVPMRVPYMVMSDEARAAGWDMPAGMESAHRVPRWARAVGEFVAAVSQTSNVGLTVMQPDLSVVRYPWTPDPAVGFGVLDRCRAWYRENIGEVRSSVAVPRSDALETAPAVAIMADAAQLALAERIAQTRARLLALRHEEAELSRELLDSMGEHTHLRHPSSPKVLAIREPGQAIIAVPRKEAAALVRAASQAIVLAETDASVKVMP